MAEKIDCRSWLNRPTELADKESIYEAYNADRFGNAMRRWNSVEEFLASDYQDPVVMRYQLRPGRLFPLYGAIITRDQVEAMAAEWRKLGADPALIRLNEGVGSVVFQGELMRDHLFLSLRYSLVDKPMRLALEEAEQYACGLQAKHLLERYLCPNSLADLWELFDRYDDAIIEFSTFTSDVGLCPRRNTIMWEVRRN
ncbi:MAG TPA: hypothetical protein VLE93_00755 [Candidatus Saccharimonadales bacterium]|nr:hypothetical protein [Candidatus Saccharimonadales bacterium]